MFWFWFLGGIFGTLTVRLLWFVLTTYIDRKENESSEGFYWHNVSNVPDEFYERSDA